MSPPDTVISVDRAHYDAIIANTEALKHLDRRFDGIERQVGKCAEDIAELKERFGDCPCPAVTALQKDTEALKTDAAVQRRTIAIVAGVATFVANGIVAVVTAWGGR